MTPYYDEDGVTIYCANVREVPIRPFKGHVLITDPPYGVNFNGKSTKHTKGDEGYTHADDPELGPRIVDGWWPFMARAAVFPGTRLMFDYPQPADVGCIYCPSGAGIGKWGFTLFHPILFYGQRPGSRLWPTSMQSFATANVEGHPCPKPLPWMRWLVELATNPDDVVIDLFAGSGTTLLAARELGRRAVGIEIEERYCEIAVQRLAQGVLEFS